MVATGLSIEGLEVRFGTTAAVTGLDLVIDAGQTVVLLGPSGCGKSTLLRAIAGLENPSAGRITWNGRSLDGVPVHQRGIGLVFQHHALFPHRTVIENVAFGLRMAGVPATRRRERAAALLGTVGLEGFGDRAVTNLSGGEAQRVALARALAPEPSLLLLDEPLAALDRPLRDRLIDDLVRLRDELDLTMVHVTHDHDEAFALADQLAVMDQGTLLVQDRPEALWARPGSTTIARFLGHPNIVDLVVTNGVARGAFGPIEPCPPLADGIHRVVIPVEDVEVSTYGGGPRGRVGAVRHGVGGHRVSVTVGGLELVGRPRGELQTGDEVSLRIRGDRVVALQEDQPR